MTKSVALIPGATGLIGTGLVTALRESYEVHCVSRHPPARGDVSWHTLDLSSAVSLEGLPSRVDKLVYLAQAEFFRDFPERSEETFQVNTGNLLRFLAYARTAGAKTFVYASSGGVYGGGEL